jgi:hypothetical protein
MSDQEPLAQELRAVEAALTSLVPMPPAAADRDRLMFAAGRAAAGPQRPWVWPAALAATALLALVVGRRTAPQLVVGPEPQIARPTITEHDPESFVVTTSPSSYLQLRRQLDRLDYADVGGVSTDARSHAPASHQALLHELLN